MTNPWPDEATLRTRLVSILSRPTTLEANLAVAWSGIAYRFASRRYADVTRFTDGEGARRYGGRFTPVGSARTLYLATDPQTATAELMSWYEYYAVPHTAFKPRLLAAVDVRTSCVLDLTADAGLSALALTRQHLVEDWRQIADSGRVASTQLFGRIVYEAGFEGILYPSARKAEGMNLALFPDNFRSGAQTIMLHADE